MKNLISLAALWLVALVPTLFINTQPAKVLYLACWLLFTWGTFKGYEAHSNKKKDAQDEIDRFLND